MELCGKQCVSDYVIVCDDLRVHDVPRPLVLIGGHRPVARKLPDF